MNATASRTLSVRSIVITGILAAVAILLGATRLGFIPVPNPSGNATIMHVPAIIAGIIAGPIS
ncbi:MAG: ECF transporter S component, partial [Caldilineaceae bacterium]|nr:ECF transporter S component [Caldilineaceae bacterium]